MFIFYFYFFLGICVFWTWCHSLDTLLRFALGYIYIYISNPKKQSLSKAGWIGYYTILNIRQMFEMRIYNITTLIINIIMIQCLTCLVNRKPDNGQNGFFFFFSLYIYISILFINSRTNIRIKTQKQLKDNANQSNITKTRPNKTK
jgi:hypothetical protein